MVRIFNALICVHILKENLMKKWLNMNSKPDKEREE